MKKIILFSVAAFLSINVAGANLDTDFSKSCNNLDGKYIVLESLPIQEKCSFEGGEISKASFEDKYNYFVNGIMINYFTEYKYSDATKWKSYTEFFAQDVEDLKIFESAKLDTTTLEKVSEYRKIQENLLTFTQVRESIGEEKATFIEKNLSNLESKVSEKQHPILYKKLQKILSKKVEELEYFQMIAHFTPEGYKKFLLKLNSYKYLLLLVEGRME